MIIGKMWRGGNICWQVKVECKRYKIFFKNWDDTETRESDEDGVWKVYKMKEVGMPGGVGGGNWPGGNIGWKVKIKWKRFIKWKKMLWGGKLASGESG